MASLPLHHKLKLARSTAPQTQICADSIQASAWPATITDNFIREWTELASKAAEPNPFLEHWFLSPALRALDPKGSVKLVQFRRDEKLFGILPIEQSLDYYGYPVPHLCSWMHDNAFCGSPLIAAGMEQAFWEALFNWAGSASRTALYLHLSHFPEEGPLFAALKATVSNQKTLAAIVHREDRAMLQSPLSPQEYFETSISAKKRKELRRQKNRLSDLGAVEFERISEPAYLPKWIEDFLKLEAAGWKGQEGSALACDAATKDLFRCSLEGAANAGALECLSLTLDGRPIAMLANFLVPPGAFSFKTAFDEDYARFSPGVLLQQENLQMLANPRIHWTDSCASSGHPMIERIWREKRTMLGVNISIGGALRRGVFRKLIERESGAEIIEP